MWEEILGHHSQIEKLKKAMAENKVPHAYLFSGIEGIGKKKVALGLAQALLGKINSDCTLIVPDGKTIRVEVLRELKQKAYLHPLESECKVFIIDSAEKMTTAGANALLKILEEPPAETYFILITSALSQILPTIRSRCQIIAFSPLVKEKLPKNPGEEELREQTLAQWESLKKSPRPSDIFKLSETWSEEDEKISGILSTLSYLFYKKMAGVSDPKALKQLTDQWLAIHQAQNRFETNANKRLLLENLLFTLTA